MNQYIPHDSLRLAKSRISMTGTAPTAETQYRIEVCGGIASGKTTATRLFQDGKHALVEEDFQSNPFWRAFYDDPAGNAFEAELTFLLQHFHQVKNACGEGKNLVCDFSFLLDRAYTNVTLDSRKRRAFAAVYAEVCRSVPPPTLLVYLSCPAETQLKRIRARARAVESAITIEYLRALNSSLKRWIGRYRKIGAVLEIDSEAIDFAHDTLGQSLVRKKIMKAIDVRSVRWKPS